MPFLGFDGWLWWVSRSPDHRGGCLGPILDAAEMSASAVGDLDADGLNEILFIGAAPKEYTATYWMAAYEQEWDKGGNIEKFVPIPKTDVFEIEDKGEGFYLIPSCAIADFKGDSKKEIIGQRRMYENLYEKEGKFVKILGDICNPDNQPVYGNYKDYSLTVGDYDGDGKADIAYISILENWMRFVGFDTSGDWVQNDATNLDGTLGDTSAKYPPVLISGDFDGNDTWVLEFQRSEFVFSDPHPIAVLAVNPFWEGGRMDGSTGVAYSKGSSQEKSSQIGVSAGTSLGYETELSFFGQTVASQSFKASFEASFDWTTTNKTWYTEKISYETSNEDKVIFTTIPYDIYIYKVIKAPKRKKQISAG